MNGKSVVQKGLQHRTVAEAATAELRRRILSGEIPAGTQLRQTALAEEFGISRIPLRESFLQLEAEGLVKVNAHRGAIVSQLSRQEIEELFEMRAALEPLLLRLSAPRLSEADYQGLALLLADYSNDLRNPDPQRWGAFNAEFHRRLYQHANRPRMQALVQNLLQDCDRHTQLHLSLAGAVARAEAEHSQLLRLCRSGQVIAAATLLEDHILNVARQLRTQAKS